MPPLPLIHLTSVMKQRFPDLKPNTGHRGLLMSQKFSDPSVWPVTMVLESSPAKSRQSTPTCSSDLSTTRPSSAPRRTASASSHLPGTGTTNTSPVVHPKAANPLSSAPGSGPHRTDVPHPVKGLAPSSTMSLTTGASSTALRSAPHSLSGCGTLRICSEPSPLATPRSPSPSLPHAMPSQRHHARSCTAPESTPMSISSDGLPLMALPLAASFPIDQTWM
mmetsp:Transcript_28199/g.69732  ORF Transcript_28199/g.69732 Transcript_28199/m.69732 type:complete len:221 (-) Transcript_28199:108-770(-)